MRKGNGIDVSFTNYLASQMKYASSFSVVKTHQYKLHFVFGLIRPFQFICTCASTKTVDYCPEVQL